MAPNLVHGAAVAWLQRRATAAPTEQTSSSPSLLWLLFLIPLVLAFLAIVALALCIARRRRRAKSRRSVLRNVSLVHEEAREKAEREARRSTSTSPGALLKRAASNGSSYVGSRVGRMTSLRSSRSGHAGGNTTVAPSSQGHGGGHARFGSSSSEKSKDPFRDIESTSSTHVLPSAPAPIASAQRFSVRSSRSQSGDSEKTWRIGGQPESSAAAEGGANVAVKFEDGFAVPALPAAPSAAHLGDATTERPSRPGQARRKELSVIGESNGNSPELGQAGEGEEKGGASAAALLGASAAAAGASTVSLARRLSNRLRPGAGSRNEEQPTGRSSTTPTSGNNSSSTTVNAVRANTSAQAGALSVSTTPKQPHPPALPRLVPPPIPSEQAPATLLSRARSAPNKVRRGPGGGGRRTAASGNRKGSSAKATARDSLEGTSWAYTSKANEWRAASASATTVGSPATTTDGSNVALPSASPMSPTMPADGSALSRSKSLDHRLVGSSSAALAEQSGGGILRRPSIGVAGSRFKERFDDDD